MSGDVFGNGMLLSEHIRLIAAFDHRHVFIDPDPGPGRLVRGTHAAVRAAAVLVGGLRHRPDLRRRWVSGRGRQKSIPMIDADARRRSGSPPSATAMAPTDLIRAILLAPVDLLWNGGIGTYIKAVHRDERRRWGTRPTTRVRVDGGELRARVVGEGGNLGVTQLGRIEFARAGGRINTDAIDNSAGVDTSDHEVNIKIALQPLLADGHLTAGGRLESADRR